MIALQTELAAFLLIVTRFGALLMSAPFFNSRWLNLRTRVLLTLMISWLALMAYGDHSVPAFEGAYWSMLVANLLFGLMMGFALQVVFQSIVVAMQSLSMQLGLGFASMVDPANGVSVPVLGQFFVIFFTFIFVSTGAHLVVLQILANSLQWFPIETISVSSVSAQKLLVWGSKMFLDAAKLVVGLMAMMLVVNLCFGLVARLAPQINIFTLGFPIMVVVGLFLIWLSLTYLTDQFIRMIDEALVAIPRWIMNG